MTGVQTCALPIYGDLPWTLDGEFGGNCRNVTIKNNYRAVDIFAPKPGAVIAASADEDIGEDTEE